MDSYTAANQLLIKIFYLTLVLRFVSSDIFSSTDHVSSMFSFEHSLLARMETFLRVSRKRLDVLKKISGDFGTVWQESWNMSTTPSETESVDNEDKHDQWKQIEAIIQWDPFQDVLRDLGEYWQNNIPDDESILGTHISLVRLIDLYRLDIAELAESGQIRDNRAASGLAPEDVRNLAIAALKDNKFVTAGHLVDAAIQLDDDARWLSGMMRLRTVASYGSQGTYQDEFDDEDDTALDEVSMDDLDLRFSWSHDSGEAHLSWTDTIETYDSDEGFQVPESVFGMGINLYEDLCRGKQIKQDNRLFCEVQHGSIPYYYWWNVEHLHLDPRVTLIYDIVTDAESERMKAHVRTKLMRAGVNTDEFGKTQISRHRLSKHAWLDPAESDMLAKGITARMTEATGLDCDQWAEDIQISVYGIGGMYEPHFDYDEKIFKYNPTNGRHMGDRIATLMLYLSDVDAGGATVFPIWRVAAFPVKNAAVFWHNIYSDGESNGGSLHGGCPVLLGHKWVANKWIHEYGQERRRPCELVRDSLEERY